jgi:hypothetical protein
MRLPPRAAMFVPERVYRTAWNRTRSRGPERRSFLRARTAGVLRVNASLSWGNQGEKNMPRKERFPAPALAIGEQE